MAPYWLLVTKNEANLSAALTQVLAMKENVVPKLAATTSHDLRLVHEMRHKVQSAEMKLRASLARKKSGALTIAAIIPTGTTRISCAACWWKSRRTAAWRCASSP